MKVLIGAACIAVIVFVGYFFWGEYSNHRANDPAVKAEIAAAFQKDCNRIIVNDAAYDTQYVASLSRDELTRRQDACIEFDKTGVVPEKSAP